jgi:tRNA A-37 threonylcarbamoyl transferase component Bud32
MSKNCENSPPCDAKDNENKEFSQQRQSKNQQASPSASYESMKSQNESKNDMKSDEKVRTTNNSQKEKGIIENETPQCKEGTLSEQKAALEKESNPSPQIISFKTRNKSESPVAKKRSKHRVYRSKKNETQPRNSKDSLNTNTKAVQIANMSISNGEIPEERKIEIKPEETKVSSETSPPESLRINTNTKDTLQSNTEGTKVIKTAKELVNDEKNDREKEISPQKKNTPQNVVSSTDNETTVITHHSNTRKSSTASSKGASPSVKKKMKAVAQISEEELNQLFVKANPKDFYTISYKIGMGSFAKVYIGKPLSKTEKSKRVAIKVMHIETPTSETKENETDKEKEKRKNKEKDARKDRRLKQVNIYSVANEIRLLNSCQHKNIVKHIMSFVWKEQIWTVMEYCDGGTLKDLLRVTLDENHIAYVLRELLEALKYLHERNRIHRDLKSDNILLNVNGDVKLADLGLSTEVGDESAMETSIAGSRYWLAPEMIRGEGYNVKADIWSLGCVALEMAEGKPPYYQYHPLKAIFYTATRGAPPYNFINSHCHCNNDVGETTEMKYLVLCYFLDV